MGVLKEDEGSENGWRIRSRAGIQASHIPTGGARLWSGRVRAKGFSYSDYSDVAWPLFSSLFSLFSLY